jgi:hypothetical protein
MDPGFLLLQLDAVLGIEPGSFQLDASSMRRPLRRRQSTKAGIRRTAANASRWK